MPSIMTLEGPKLRPVPCDPRSVDPEQLRLGTQIEMEHTRDPVAAQTIALHHLCESAGASYYIPGAAGGHERLLLNGTGVWAKIPTWVKWMAAGGAAVGLYLAARKAMESTAWGEQRYAQARERSFHGAKLGDPKRIANDSKTIEEYARRVEAWNASEAHPQSLTKLARAWAGGRDAGKTMRLLREARESRMEGRERLWSRMSHGLRA